MVVEELAAKIASIAIIGQPFFSLFHCLLVNKEAAYELAKSQRSLASTLGRDGRPHGLQLMTATIRPPQREASADHTFSRQIFISFRCTAIAPSLSDSQCV